jgi:hypothetical protein
MTKAKHMELISMEEPFLTTEATTVFLHHLRWLLPQCFVP